MHLLADAPPAERADRSVGYLLVAALVAVVIVVAGTGSLGAQLYLVVLAVSVGLAIPLIRRANRIEPTLSIAFLWGAFLLKVGGSLLRFLALKLVYHGVGDATGYHSAGVHFYASIRHLDFGFLQPPFVDTDSIRYLTGFVYAVIGPTEPGGFLVYALLSLLGQWWFYRAFRVAFPASDHRLYGWLIFFLPSLLFWPSSIGKDAVMLFGLGLATYSLALLLRRLAVRPLLGFAAGFMVAFTVRPPVGAALIVAAGLAFLIQPSQTQTNIGRAIAWVIGIPLVFAVGAYVLAKTGHYLRLDGTGSALQQYETAREGLAKGGSSFTPPSLSNPGGAALGVFTALFRPLPWEISNPLVAIAGLEGTVLAVLFVWRIRAVLRTLAGWRNGLVVYAVVMSLVLTGFLTGFGNFGLLVRQRTSLLPFLLIFPAAGAFAAIRRDRPPGARRVREAPPAAEAVAADC